MAVTPAGTPYVESSDNVADYPGVSLALANHIDGLDGGKVLQVVTVFKADTFSTTSVGLIDVTGLSATITPSAVSSKILVMVSLPISTLPTGYAGRGAILRGATVVGGGTAVGSRPSVSFFHRMTGSAGDNATPKAFAFIDAPATTAATTYKVQLGTESGGTVSIGFSYANDSDVAAGGRIASSIILMEVAP